MSAKADYERFLADVETIIQSVHDINVAGIASGICDDLTKIATQLVLLKSKARFVGSHAHAAETQNESNET